MGGAGVGFEGGEAGGIPEVGRDRHRAGVAAADHLGVDHRVPRPHVGQQASVTIARLEIELESHRSTDEQGRVGASRADASASARAPRTALARFMCDLRGVDADVANALDAVPQPHVDGVAIVHVHDRCGDGAGRLRDRRTGSGDRQDGRGESDPEHPRATCHRSHADTPRVDRQCPESWTAIGRAPPSLAPRRIKAPPMAIRNGGRGARCICARRSSAAAARRSASRASTSSPVT